jgi:predicted pyridoxine 5'-phosphate oxidase superfamily flavin-nucleotide-binding protein
MISSDVAFSPTVKAIQARRGSRQSYEKVERRGGFQTEVTADLAAFLSVIDTAFLATASAAGQPYAQHRGGPKGFIKVVDAKTLGFVDFKGNRQYISTGNLAENERAFLILMDYTQRRRVKVWGRARVVEDDPDLLARLMPQGYSAKPDQAILFTIDAWDVNCPQHIPQMIAASDVAEEIAGLRARIEALEAENAALRQNAGGDR